ncbi:SMP-30/gluconolactonase/LRE family protein [Falsigemmobacter faecalis]|uniref:Strictosidine synthase n=1 Tax=Falsigemmobacter faecalis TaxID=2488730 RepID=A0A3P3DJA0_9RHOB|nr:strictosidine synthase [Falsigemmobacter faecalis]RRH74317.1 strictosidine synthase [Falsigemmobacter faecalis]
MIGALRRVSDRLLGRGEAALTVPPLDGAWKPNNRLEEAAAGHGASAPMALVLQDGRPLWAEGARVMSAAGEIRIEPGVVTAMALSPAGVLAVGSDGIAIGGERPAALAGLRCITALAWDAEGALWIAIGSELHGFAERSRDFLEQRRAGKLLRWADGQLSTVAEKLGFPWGLMPRDGGMVVAESWCKRLIWIDKSGQRRVLAEDLPGYPAGLAATPSGGAWLALFAPRSPLLELVLREPKYRREMMAEVPPDYWIAPALSSGRSFLEPMQGGALKQMGILKPWAPSRSAGLVAEFNAAWTPLQSLHSRAGGRRHGVTALAEAEGSLWLAVTGGDEVLRISVREEAR